MFGFWNDDMLAGLIAVIDCREYNDPNDDDPKPVFLWRMMVGEGHQRKGHGRAVLDFLRNWIRERGLPTLVTSAVPNNAVATGLNEGFGFTRTGRIVVGEVELYYTI